MIKRYFEIIGRKSKKAFENKVKNELKNKVLNHYAHSIQKNVKSILSQNKKDISYAKKIGLKDNFISRLELDTKKLRAIISSINSISKLKDPTDRILEQWKRPNGLKIKKVSVPIGVIGVIYESRPNVTSDVSCLCFKSGNSVILKGGSEAYFTNKILSNLFRRSLKFHKIDPNFVQFVDMRSRKVVDHMLSKMTKYIDIIIPRGGKSLVKKVQDTSKLPVIGHLEGLCHTYIDSSANLKMALKVVLNAKLRNTAICGATETILLNDKLIKKFSKLLITKLENNGCVVYTDNKIRKVYKGNSFLASEKDWMTEYLTSKISIKSVKNVIEAINHINKYGTQHTDAIICKNKKTSKIFLKNVKSSIAMHNTSTQFADGGEFGFGAEVGISTNNLPPRGPVGLGQLVSYKYEVFGSGQIRK
jgi:glutamate-5-semialdehyde dehydrogenase